MEITLPYTLLLDIDQNQPFYKDQPACFIVTRKKRYSMNFMACALIISLTTTKEIKRCRWCRISCGKYF